MGKQLEAQHTAVPASPEDSNAAASQSASAPPAPASTDKPAGKQLQTGQNAIPVDANKSNAAAASQVAPTSPGMIQCSLAHSAHCW